MKLPLLSLILFFTLTPMISYCQKTPKDIVREVKHTVQYQEDLIDYYQTPEETLKLKTGDCEDFAILIQKLCQDNNIKTEIYCLYPQDSVEGHAIVIGQYKGKYWYSSNDWFSYVDKLEDISGCIASEMHWRGKIEMVTLKEIQIDIASK